MIPKSRSEIYPMRLHPRSKQHTRKGKRIGWDTSNGIFGVDMALGDPIDVGTPVYSDMFGRIKVVSDSRMAQDTIGVILEAQAKSDHVSAVVKIFGDRHYGSL